MPFFTVTDADVKAARTTDVYFERTEAVLRAHGLSGLHVAAEITAGSFPEGWPWAVFAGLEEALTLLEGLPVTVHAVPEGTIVRNRDPRRRLAPVLLIEGRYLDFCRYEAPLLGLLCQATGIATKAARVRLAAGEGVPVVSFGVRRMHPAIAPMIDRAALIGGLDDVSCVASAERFGLRPRGTMPHALVLAFNDSVAAFRAFHDTVPPEVPRVALVDTFCDEKREALAAAQALGDALSAVRLDTPASRRGDFRHLVSEVRWELDRHGFEHVRIFLSGGLDEGDLQPLLEAGADGFGVGTSVAGAPTVDFGMDIVEREGVPLSKRGKFSGRKQVLRCMDCSRDEVVTFQMKSRPCEACGGDARPLLHPVLDAGRRVHPEEPLEVIRERSRGERARIRAMGP